MNNPENAGCRHPIKVRSGRVQRNDIRAPDILTQSGINFRHSTSTDSQQKYNPGRRPIEDWDSGNLRQGVGKKKGPVQPASSSLDLNTPVFERAVVKEERDPLGLRPLLPSLLLGLVGWNGRLPATGAGWQLRN